MNKKLMSILMCMLMIISAVTTILYTKDIEVEASGGSGNNETGLDYNFMWNVTNYLSDIINTSYHGNVIRKGRSFGTVGEFDVARYINNTVMAEKLHLENVTQLQLGPIENETYYRWYYTSKLEINDYNITLNQQGYPYHDAMNGRLPYNETFVFPSAYKNKIDGSPKSLNYRHNFTGIRLWNTTVFNLESFFGGQFTGQYYNVTNCSMVNYQSLLIGNVTYVENIDSLPGDQEGMILLVDKKEGCQQILENITNASAVVLVDNNSKYCINQSIIDNCSCQILHVNKNETNLTSVINNLKNGTVMMADNYYNNQTITFSYGFDGILNKYWPDYDFFVLVWCDDTHIKALLTRSVLLYFANNLLHWNPLSQHGWCHGIIYYGSNEKTHEMNSATKNWRGYATDILQQNIYYFANSPGLQMISLNYTTGRWLAEKANFSSNTISGFIDQTFIEEKHPKRDDPINWTVGVTSYNVEGKITTKNNPTNAIIVCSNRYDSWWGECPGDSGAGAGIVLAIAKYMKDNNITPKYNITFLEDTGEEYGFRGAWHYSQSHPPGQSSGQYNIIRWIGFDQLGFNQKSGPLDLSLRVNNLGNNYDTDSRILHTIANDTTIGYDAVNITPAEPGLGITEDVAWITRPNCKTIGFSKDNSWQYHHETGKNFIEGDSMKNMNRSELNATLDFAWLVMKYYAVNPDCSFDKINFTAVDSPNDGDTLPDSIRVDFNISSILPSDKVMVNGSLRNQSGFPVEWSIKNYTISHGGVTVENQSFTFTLPTNLEQGVYTLQLRLYNSTGRINKILNKSDNKPNETRNSSLYLYHPFGYPTPGNLSISTDDAIRGSCFTANEYGTVRNITAYIRTNTTGPSVHSMCMIYRKNDSRLIGQTEEITVATGLTPHWVVYDFPTSSTIFEKNTEYVLVCWSDALCDLYYDFSAPTTRGRCQFHTYGSPPDPAQWNSTDTHLYSIYCSYENDSTPPNIANVTTTPHVIGLGGNVIISADVMDDVSGVKTVKVYINPPGGISNATNYTMTPVNNHSYQYVFNDTWLTGQYNCTIWATDFSNNTASSTGHHFHVSANATISIATIQDSYSGTQYINITDPPNPSENYTIVGRGLDWNNYYDAVTGQNVLEVSAGPINYLNETNDWTPINCTFQQLPEDHPAYPYGYRVGNNRGLFGVYFKPDLQSDWPVAFTYNKTDDTTMSVIRSKLVGVGYVDPQSNWAYEYLQNVQSSQGLTDNSSITYPGVFTGTDVTWSYGNTGLKEEITLSNVTRTVLQNHPPSQYGLNDASSYLVFITRLDYQNLDMYNASGKLTGNVTISDKGVDFRDALGQFKCALPLGEAYELNNESVRQKLIYRIIHLNGNTYLLSGLKVSDLNTMTFPVVIDPTLTVESLTNDGYISSSSSSYSTVWSASSGTVDSSATYISLGQKKVTSFPTSTYYIYRGFVLFNTSALPSNAYLDHATLSLYKKDDYSSSDFDITIQNGQSTYPHNPLQSSDYNKNDYAGNGGH